MNWFKQLLSGTQFGMALKTREEVGRTAWNQAVDSHANGSWWHRYEWLDYCLAYKGGADYSFAAVHEGIIVALYPLIQEGARFMLGGNPMVAALMHPSAPNQLISIAMNVGKNLVNVVALNHGVKTGEMMLPISAKGPLPKKTTFCEPDHETETADFSTRVIDLQVPVEERWKAVRKSYHQLIRRGRELYRITSCSAEGFDEYHRLHLAMYGVVRNSATYAAQKAFLGEDRARLYIAKDVQDVTVGATLWYLHNGLAYYASGVYFRDNLAHAILWESLNHLATLGVKYAELGWQGRASDEKGKAVEFFKRGLGGTDWPVPCIRRTFLTHQQEAAS